jgi:hypothetical protein
MRKQTFVIASDRRERGNLIVVYISWDCFVGFAPPRNDGFIVFSVISYFGDKTPGMSFRRSVSA